MDADLSYLGLEEDHKTRSQNEITKRQKQAVAMEKFAPQIAFTLSLVNFGLAVGVLGFLGVLVLFIYNMVDSS